MQSIEVCERLVNFLCCARVQDVQIQRNGAVPHTMYLWEVKKRDPGEHKWDVFKRIGTVPSPGAYPPPNLFGCPLVAS